MKMFINDLPDECILIIFSYLNFLSDFSNCSNVCMRWKYLIQQTLFPVRYLTNVTQKNYSKTILHTGEFELENGKHTSELLTNLRVVQMISKQGYNENFILDILKSSQKLIGLVIPVITNEMLPHCSNIEMIATRFFQTQLLNILEKSGTKIEQLYTYDIMFPDLQLLGENLPNVIRLHIERIHCNEINHFIRYNGPVLKKLKILEISTRQPLLHQYKLPAYFHLLDFCPCLTSAYFNCDDGYDRFINKYKKNYTLRDLVIEYTNLRYRNVWPSIRKVLRKLPNLKHLALRYNKGINDDHLIEIITMLPKLRILDLSFCHVKHEYADKIELNYKKAGRDISIYTRDIKYIKLDWPQLSDDEYNQIDEPFNFMQHCFLKKFDDLPKLMY